MKTTRLRSLTGEQRVMANTKLLEREIHNLSLAKARRTTLYLAVGGKISAEAVDPVLEAAEHAVSAQKGCKLARCVLSGAGAGGLAFDLVYDDNSRDNDKLARNRSAILRALMEQLAVHGLQLVRASDQAAGAASLLMPVASLDEIRSRVGEEVGVSGWLVVDQARIDAFADATEDRQFIHLDAEAAARTPFGGTIAHGFLTLSLLSRMAAEAMLLPEGLKMVVNYGLDRVRFLAPVRSGSRVRGRFVLDSVEEKAPGQWLMRHIVTVEIEGGDKPALTAVWLTLLII